MKLIQRFFTLVNQKGIAYILRIIWIRSERYLVSHGFIKKRIKNFKLIKKLFKGRAGLEIGGPSPIFKNNGYLPLYPLVVSLDGCNFSSKTIWEGNIQGGKTYNYYKKHYGVQFISDATELGSIANQTYEFVVSSNCLEHVANPLKAVKEWLRVLKKEGLILLLLPNKEYCFDHKRQVISFDHLLEDYNNETKEDDLTHLSEILEFHDLEMDKQSGNFEQFKARSLNNFENRSLHHHIFDLTVLKEMFEFFDVDVLFVEEGKNHIILGRKK